MGKEGMNVGAQVIMTNWIVKCFVMSPYELVVCKLQRFWRKRSAKLRYEAVIRLQLKSQRELEKIIEIGHRHTMQLQESLHQTLLNRYNMFECERSRPQLIQYRAARRVQCAVRCHLARGDRRKRVPAAVKIQKVFRGWKGRKSARWQRTIRRLKEEEANALLYLRQKYVADATADTELAVLARYTRLEKQIATARRDIVDRDVHTEQDFKRQARRAQKVIRRAKGWGPWVPQMGSVSGRTFYFHSETGEVREEEPHDAAIQREWDAIQRQLDAKQRPYKREMAANLESLRGHHASLHSNVTQILQRTRELHFKSVVVHSAVPVQISKKKQNQV